MTGAAEAVVSELAGDASSTIGTTPRHYTRTTLEWSWPTQMAPPFETPLQDTPSVHVAAWNRGPADRDEMKENDKGHNLDSCRLPISEADGIRTRNHRIDSPVL